MVNCRNMMFCCGAAEIGHFGGGEPWSDEQDEESVASLTKEIKGTLRSLKRAGNSVVYATTMSNQPNAIKALEEIGFYTSTPFQKTHVEEKPRTMQAWFLPLSEFKA